MRHWLATVALGGLLVWGYVAGLDWIAVAVARGRVW